MPQQGIQLALEMQAQMKVALTRPSLASVLLLLLLRGRHPLNIELFKKLGKIQENDQGPLTLPESPQMKAGGGQKPPCVKGVTVQPIR